MRVFRRAFAILIVLTLLILAFQNFTYEAYVPGENTPGKTEPLVAPKNPGSNPDPFREDLEKSARFLESNLRYQWQTPASESIYVQLLDRNGEMKVEYKGLAYIGLVYDVDQSDMNLAMKKQVSLNSSLQLEHKPKENHSTVNMNWSW